MRNKNVSTGQGDGAILGELPLTDTEGNQDSLRQTPQILVASASPPGIQSAASH